MIKKFALAATVTALVGFGAEQAMAANPVLPNLTNLNFQTYSGTNPKDCFTCVNPAGWSGGTGLIFIDSTATFG